MFAGEDEAKELLTEIVDYLHNPRNIRKLAHIPKGALLLWPSCNRKDSSCKSSSGEAEVPFFSISGSEFVEMFVGMGAAKVRDLLSRPMKRLPVLYSIDDGSIGKKRDGAGFSGGNDGVSRLFNQLLTEMDGFDGSKGVVSVAATNRPDSLTRLFSVRGVLTEEYAVSFPASAGKEEILKVHAKKIKIADTVRFDKNDERLLPHSRRKLRNIVNEAALRAVRDGRKFATQADFEESIEVVIAGYQKKNRVLFQ